MTTKYKYPRTSHIQNSKKSDDDLECKIENLFGKTVQISEKIDGENTTCYSTGEVHARSIDSNNSVEYRAWIKNFWETLRFSDKFPKILNFDRIVFENCYATHSLYYSELLSYAYALNVWKDDICLSVIDTQKIFKDLELVSPTVYFSGKLLNIKTITDITSKLDQTKVEGIVIRVIDEIPLREFPNLVLKWVRPNHVQTDVHWSKTWTKNKLKTW